MSIFADRRRFLERTSGALALGLVGAAPARPGVDAELLERVRHFERCRARLAAVESEYDRVDRANPCQGGTPLQYETVRRFEQTVLDPAARAEGAARRDLVQLLGERGLRGVVVGDRLYTDLPADPNSDRDGVCIPLSRVAGLKGGGRC